MSLRLGLAIDAGLEIPSEGQILVLHPPGDANLSVLPRDRCIVVQPFLPDLQTLTQVQTRPDMPSGERFAATILFLPRAKDLARALIAQASAMTEGMIVLDGAKTDGIESVLKDLRKRTEVHGVLSKAHGKILWFDPLTECDDWAEVTRDVDGMITRPGVFSADGIDPASGQLVAHMPDVLGKRVVDLGAGWGYLSRAILARKGVETLHLVEADHRALSCAQQNISDPRAQFHWADARSWRPADRVDVVVTNPPFHTGRAADPSLGQAFIASAAEMLTPSGFLVLVANRHLPYEATLADRFAHVTELGGDSKFKILRAERPTRRRR